MVVTRNENNDNLLSNVHVQRNPAQRTGFISSQPTRKTLLVKRMLTDRG